MKSLNDVTAPTEGVRFWTWGARTSADFFFKTELGEPQISEVGLLEAEVVVDGVDYVFAPGSRRLLYAMKPFAPVRGKTLRVTVHGEGMDREFVIAMVMGPDKTQKKIDAPRTLDERDETIRLAAQLEAAIKSAAAVPAAVKTAPARKTARPKGGRAKAHRRA